MNQLGLSIPPFTGAPWWTTSYSDSTDSLVKKEEVDGRDTRHQVDYGSSQDFPVAKRQKRNCDQDQGDND